MKFKLSSFDVTRKRFRLHGILPRGAARGAVGAGIALALLTAGAVGVGASTWAGVGSGFGSPGSYSPPPAPAVVGTVASVATSPSDVITLTTKHGTTWTVDVTGSTTYTDSAVTSPTFADVAVGDELFVYGTTTATDTVSATNVTIMVKPVVVGTVATTPSGDTFTLTAWKGQTWTVTVTGSTAYTERGVTSPTLSNVVVGDEVVVYGTSTGTDAVAATSVVIIERPIVQGTVASVTTSPTDSFTVMAKKGQTWTVTVTGSTTYTECKVTSPSFANIAVGDGVVVFGISTATDAVTATSVAIMQHPVVVGTVASVTTSPSDSFTVSAWKMQTVTVDVTGSTTYTEHGVTSPSFSNVTVGDLVAVYGTSAGASTFDATSVAITQLPAVTGKVASVTTSPSDSFTLTARGGQTWTINVSGTTTYSECGVSSPSFSSLAVGNQVAVYGTSTGTNTVDATSVVILFGPSIHPKPSPWAVGLEPSGKPSPTGLLHYPVGVSTVAASGSSSHGYGHGDPTGGKPGGLKFGFGSGGSQH
jgi:hypothetical protein